MNNADKLTIKELKQIVNEILDDEAKTNNLKVNAFPVTFIEYYTDFLFKGKFSLQRVVNYASFPFNSLGFHSNGNIVILINSIKKIVKGDPPMVVFELLNVVYHELRHNFQKHYDNHSYEKFLSSLEEFLRLNKSGEFNYKSNHDDFSFEIGAHLYGIRRAKEYLINKYPEIYEEAKDYIDYMEEYYLLDYYMYDASNIFDLAIPIIREELKNGIISGNYIYINSDGSFRSIRDMIDNSIFMNLDIRIRSAITSSRTFLKELDYGQLSYDELKFLYDMVNYTNTIYDNQLSYLKKLIGKRMFSNNSIVSKMNSIIDKKKELAFYIDKIGLYMSVARVIEDKKNRS